MPTALQSALRGKHIVSADDDAADDDDLDDRCANSLSAAFPVFAIDANHEHAGCRPHGPAQPAESSDDEDAPAIAGITEDDTSFVQDGLRSAFPMSFGRSIMTFGRATRRLPV